MADNFEWWTEDERDEVWQDTDQPEPASPTARRWWLALLLLVLVAGAIYYAYGAAEEQVTEAEALTAEDVLASHRLAQAAARDGDRELLATVLSGRQQRWTQMQFQLMEERLLFTDAARALGLQPLPEPGAVVDVSFSPDLRAAEVLSEYAVVQEPGDEPVTMQQVHVYRRGDQGWLLSPPLSDFWGTWRVWQGRRLTLHHTERDTEVAERLAGDLDDMLDEMCATLQGVECPPEMRVRVRLERDVSSVRTSARAQVSVMVADELSLPGPTLIGVPVDDAAYATVYPAYARRVASAAISDLVGYRCCDEIVFFKAALDWQLAQLGLQPWPLTRDHYVQVAQELDGPSRLARLWSMSELPRGEWNDRWHAYSLVELLLARGEATALNRDVESVSAALLQRRLSSADTLSRWIASVSEHNSTESLMMALRSYLIERASEWQAAPPPPGQELVLACADRDRADIYRYIPGQERWQRGLPGLEFGPDAHVSEAVGLPDGSGLLVSTWDQAAGAAALFLWQPDGVAQLQTDRTSFELHSSRYIDPLGRYAGVWAWNRERGDSGYALLDLERCATGACAWEALAGWPIWSPDGRHLLYSVDDNAVMQTPIVLRSREARASLQMETGSQPFWLNDRIFGFLDAQQLMLAGVTGGEARPAIAFRDIYEHLGGDADTARHVRVEHVLASPGDDEFILFILRNPIYRESFVVRLQGDGSLWLEESPPVDTAEVLLQTRDLVFGPPLATVSPGGRWLTLQTAGQGEGRFIILDLEEDEIVLEDLPRSLQHTTLAWSQDGEWLARLNGSYIELIAPEHGPYRRPLLPHSESSQSIPSCRDVAWVNPTGG
ncbi:MAG TPA: hypothetical protein VK879_21760 [Candidatus Sulfomarinibacteraceae bacterium]|nr:hypothetical protein [Candidatus Sulfomarinibacteraceae bacterium]